MIIKIKTYTYYYINNDSDGVFYVDTKIHDYQLCITNGKSTIYLISCYSDTIPRPSSRAILNKCNNTFFVRLSPTRHIDL